ncbi:Uncharacterised protein [Vibrio cholerae]|nr:Uncharacterised protein [Vibrio cholerae]CSB90481.1 Uncharacterised protein [Vibrio cholerae]CSD02985.1 Uncharacterised protein [Vibrio cholerae]
MRCRWVATRNSNHRAGFDCFRIPLSQAIHRFFQPFRMLMRKAIKGWIKRFALHPKCTRQIKDLTTLSEKLRREVMTHFMRGGQKDHITLGRNSIHISQGLHWHINQPCHSTMQLRQRFARIHTVGGNV